MEKILKASQTKINTALQDDSEVCITDAQSLDRLSLQSQEELEEVNLERYLQVVSPVILPPSSPARHLHLYDHHDHNQGAGRAASWSKDFDSLLADPTGLQRFTDFLQQEFRFGSLLWVCD